MIALNRKYFEREAAHIKTTPFGIFVDQAGYLPESRKIAVLPFEAESFELADESGSVRYTGKTSYFGKDEASGDDIRLADFSGFREPGKYRVRAEGQLSAQFCISESVYDSVLRDTMRAFYYLRCGCALEEKYALQYVHPACHTSEAVLWDDHSVRLEVTGGWHDAGDYGRYVTAGACAVGHLLYAYMLFPKAFEKLSLNIPETGLPDLLAEVRYELDWMLKMQREDGGVYHKVTTAQHAPFVMPEEDSLFSRSRLWRPPTWQQQQLWLPGYTVPSTLPSQISWPKPQKEPSAGWRQTRSSSASRTLPAATPAPTAREMQIPISSGLTPRLIP